MAKTDTIERGYAGAATSEEGKFFAALQKLVPLTDTIKGVSFRFGVDSEDAPAVWITIKTTADVNPSEAKIRELNSAAESLRSAALNSKYDRWPYIQIITE